MIREEKMRYMCAKASHLGAYHISTAIYGASQRKMWRCAWQRFSKTESANCYLSASFSWRSMGTYAHSLRC